jgi:uncharacterized protein DUF1186/SEC-C motif-containing protein
MTSALPAGIPPLEEETSYSRERILDALRNEVALPSDFIMAGTLYADAIEADIIDVLERARLEELDDPSWRLLFRGIHIVGGRRLPGAYRPLVAFLHGQPDRVKWLLGDAITENLSRILAGLFDGDEQPLHALVIDQRVHPFVREAALYALSFLAFERRIDRSAFEAFLLHFDEAKLAAPDDDVMWHAWMTSAAALGVKPLEARVRAAFADGRIDPTWADEDDFDDLLRAAIARPEDRTRLESENMGYLEDVPAALEKFQDPQDDDSDDDDAFGPDERVSDWIPDTPAHNPFRDVGRNDPCPCGSGKKFKKCCLPRL